MEVSCRKASFLAALLIGMCVALQPAVAAQPCQGGGGEPVNVTPCAYVDVRIFSDANYTAPSDYFHANDDAFFFVNVTDFNGTALSGNLTIYRYPYEEVVSVNGTYYGNFTVAGDDHSGIWWLDMIFDDGNCTGWNATEYVVEPILSEVHPFIHESLDCGAYSGYDFAPGDTAYIVFMAFDQAGYSVDYSLFSAFNATSIVVYNYTGNPDIPEVIIFNQTFESLENYAIECYEEAYNYTYNRTFYNVLNLTLPGHYDKWLISAAADTAYGQANGSNIIATPLYLANVSFGQLYNPGQNATLGFGGWVNANNESVEPSDNIFYVSMWNISEFSGQHLGSYGMLFNISDAYSFVTEYVEGTNIESVGYSGMKDGMDGYSQDIPFNISHSLGCSFVAQAKYSRGSIAELVLDMTWADAEPYSGLSSVNVTVAKPSGQQTVAFNRTALGRFAANLSLDEEGGWSLLSNFTDPWNNTCSASQGFSVETQQSNNNNNDGGSGGGGGGGGRKGVAHALEFGSNNTLKLGVYEGDNITYAGHTISVFQVGMSVAKFMVFSEQFNVTLQLGETGYLDLDRDGNLDLTMGLDRISGTLVELTFVRLEQQAAPQETQPGAEAEEEAARQPAGPTGYAFAFPAVGIGSLVAVLAALVAIFAFIMRRK